MFFNTKGRRLANQETRVVFHLLLQGPRQNGECNVDTHPPSQCRLKIPRKGLTDELTLNQQNLIHRVQTGVYIRRVYWTKHLWLISDVSLQPILYQRRRTVETL